MSNSRSAPTADRLLELSWAMADQPILMPVDLVADRFLSGRPKRISREAPVLILTYEGESLTPGGGANAVANVSALGGQPLPLGVVGDDESGERLLAVLQEAGIPTDGVLLRPGYRTPTKTRILAGGHHSIKQQIVRFDIEEKQDLSESEAAAIRDQLAQWQGRSKVAILSDYGYGAVSPSLVAGVRECVGPDGIILCDSRYRLAQFAGLDGATPNEEEAEALLQGPISESQEQLLAAGTQLLELLGARFLLITRGSFGMCLFDEDGMTQIPVHGTDQVADVTGAGDTVIGTLALALAAGASPLEAALMANYAAGIVVMKRGTATLSRRELEMAITADPRPLAKMKWAKF
jgi:rfaE bifunctional protein kinase chain/domain